MPTFGFGCRPQIDNALRRQWEQHLRSQGVSLSRIHDIASRKASQGKRP
jgi:hypothetical protein